MLSKLLRRARSFDRRLWGAPLALILGGCAIHTPVRMTPAASVGAPDASVQVSLTHAVVDPARRAPFDRYVNRVATVLPGEPGLLLYSIRRELFGNQVWTMTAWRSAEDRARFFASGLHREAMAEAGAAIVHVRTVRVVLPRSALPVDWDWALATLGEPPWASVTLDPPKVANRN